MSKSRIAICLEARGQTDRTCCAKIHRLHGENRSEPREPEWGGVGYRGQARCRFNFCTLAAADEFASRECDIGAQRNSGEAPNTVN